MKLDELRISSWQQVPIKILVIQQLLGFMGFRKIQILFILFIVVLSSYTFIQDDLNYSLILIKMNEGWLSFISKRGD